MSAVTLNRHATPDRACGKIILRRVDGSHPEVRKVYAYDPRNDCIVCMLFYKHDQQMTLERLSLGELEAVDVAGKYIDVPSVVAMRADHIINRDDLVAVEKPGS